MCALPPPVKDCRKWKECEENELHADSGQACMFSLKIVATVEAPLAGEVRHRAG